MMLICMNCSHHDCVDYHENYRVDNPCNDAYDECYIDCNEVKCWHYSHDEKGKLRKMKEAGK